jgi:RHS repeat-associated protein
MSVPIAASPGRSGFGPQLSLSYDSGSGNGPFGLGWSLSLPSITRKTDKGLPRYQDAIDSDVFILSGAEDLVPEFKKDVDGNWIVEDNKHVIFEELHLLDGVTYIVRRYRPRIEGLFARIERWTNPDDPQDTFWRSISKDNITTWYGKRSKETAESRIADPADQSRIFSWLICQSYDDKGNAIIYEYAAEDEDNVDLTQANERNRSRKANRYLKRIKYGNRKPNRDPDTGNATDPTQLLNETWMFELVFDYDEGHYLEDAPDAEGRIFARAVNQLPEGSARPVRQDPFSSYRASFEVRTYRLCRRALMFHHFPQELDIADCLVRSTEFAYDESPIASFITSVSQSGFVQQLTQDQPNRYLKKSPPPVEFEYSKVPSSEELAQRPIREVDAESLENLPIGLDGAVYQWIDLDGEGTNGILTEQGTGWYYKRNLSSNNLVRENGDKHTVARLGPVELVAKKPAPGLNGDTQFLDLAGDGQVDLAQMEDSVSGFYERTQDADWEPFQPFVSWPNLNTRDPNLRFVDLTGDGHADILITEGEALTWYLSLAEAGFGLAVRVSLPLDEEKGPRLIFADSEQSIHLADLSGDGMTDLVRIRNGEVCYWPNLGYGCFGAKVTMDNAPWFDAPDQFDQQRIRLADIDGSGVTDILYLRRDGVQIYFNHSGNRWSESVALPQFPPVDPISSVQALDLLGNGTVCLVWSSPLPSAVRRPMLYLALMDDKPHLLVEARNNLGAETKVHYAPSTKFYLDDKQAGKPWITKLPFIVHMVERVEIYDHISHNRFVTRYTYHHGYFDGIEREFRGFGMVEQFDTEEIGSLLPRTMATDNTNWDATSFVPTVLTKTWFHTGAYVGRAHISNFFDGSGKGDGEYYREPTLQGDVHDLQAQSLLLLDTVLPPGLTLEEEREACRALKGAMLRQEVYALDGKDDTDKAEHPYNVAEQNFTIQRLQPRGDNPFGVFFTHAREAITYHYERKPDDPRVQHVLTLEVDEYGDVLKEAAIGYGRRMDATNPMFSPEDRAKQRLIHITCTENTFTNPIIEESDDYRTPLPAESRTYELRKPEQEKSPDGLTRLYSFDAILAHVNQAADGNHDVEYEDFLFEKAKQAATNDPEEGEKYFRRLIEHVRTLYRPDDLGASQNDVLTLLPLGRMELLALPGESYKLAFTPGLLDIVYRRGGENLLPDPAQILPIDDSASQVSDRGGYVDLDNNDHWWIPSGRMFYSPDTNDSPAQERAFAGEHFFLPHRYRNPFHSKTFNSETTVTFDNHVFLMQETKDALENTVIAENDYRILAPRLMIDPNSNRSEVAYDALGMIAGTAVMGKENEPDGNPKGDLLDGFEPNLTQNQLETFINKPREAGPSSNESVATAIVYELLGKATTRNVYDLDRYRRLNEPPFAATIARETHVSDLNENQQSQLQVSISYSDGFGREIQKKIQAEPGPVPQRDAEGKIILGEDGQPLMTTESISPRWVGSGWTIFNNKGKPVRQYEPFFTDRYRFEFEVRIGVSPVLFYDPVKRVVATLLPNHTWEKVVFDAWQQTTYDVNDTVRSDPSADEDVKGFFVQPDGTPRLPSNDYLPTWHALRTDPVNAVEFAKRYPDPTDRANETSAANKTVIHADTPTVAHFDALGRPFLTIAYNRFQRENTNAILETIEEKYSTRVELDIEGNQRSVIDTKDRLVMKYDYDMLGNRIHQASMEAGERWMLNDVSGKLSRAWDSRDQEFLTTYDSLRRPVDSYLKAGRNPEIRIGHAVYGETLPQPEDKNLRGQVVELFDQAGVLSGDEYDFKGNLLHSRRQLASNYKTTLNWMVNEPLEAEKYDSRTLYDTFNRPIQIIAPHSNLLNTKINVLQPFYNEANLLEQVNVWLNQNSEPVKLLDPESANLPAVKDIDYDAKGQRMLIKYGNDVETTYKYDPLTFRLIHLQTLRGNEPLQDLSYIYDPAGNITAIRDDAQQTIFFNGRRVEPSAEYIYDAIYRLIEATGREHLGQTGGQLNPPTPPDAFNAFHIRKDHPGNGEAMGKYTERYVYDAVGNFEMIQHHGIDPAHPGWTRVYTYGEHSQLELAKTSNRLTSTSVGTEIEQYSQDGDGYDLHGNMLKLLHLPVIQWDYRDQLQVTSQQNTNNGVTPEITYYVYDASGQRLRKVTERQAPAEAPPSRKKERIYLGGFEIFREYKTDGEAVELERETLHIMDDRQRIALVETRTQGNDNSPGQAIRYQFSNHLGSASLELNHQAQIISYEEYYPYGSTSYQAVQTDLEVAAKRYRYTGKERDEESGLYYHGARYYATWLGSWISVDPIGLADGVCLYKYSKNNPIVFVDLTGLQPFECTPEAVDCIPPSAEPVNPVGTHREGEGTLDAGVMVPHSARTADDQVTYWASGEVNWDPLIEVLLTITQIAIYCIPYVGQVVLAWDTGLYIGETITGESSGVHLRNLLTWDFDAGRKLSTSERVIGGVAGALGATGIGIAAAGARAAAAGANAASTGSKAAAAGANAASTGSKAAAAGANAASTGSKAVAGEANAAARGTRALAGKAKTPSLRQQANKAGVGEEIEGEFEVFAHGTTDTVARGLINSQGGNLSASGGNFGGQLFTVPNADVAGVFAARSAARVAGQQPAVVGIALPRSVVASLKQQNVLRLGPIEIPPPGVSSGAQQWVFEAGALDTLKLEGFFFGVRW